MIRLKQYLKLKIRSKVGVNSPVMIASLIALVAGLTAFCFIPVIVFFWLCQRYSPVTAGLISLGAFLFLGVAAALVAAIAHRSEMKTAERVLARQSAFSFVQPAHITTALQVAHKLGWQRIVALAGVAFLAAGLVREWSARQQIDYSGEPGADS